MLNESLPGILFQLDNMCRKASPAADSSRTPLRAENISAFHEWRVVLVRSRCTGVDAKKFEPTDSHRSATSRSQVCRNAKPTGDSNFSHLRSTLLRTFHFSTKLSLVSHDAIATFKTTSIAWVSMVLFSLQIVIPPTPRSQETGPLDT
jgi:hypothetical protein